MRSTTTITQCPQGNYIPVAASCTSEMPAGAIIIADTVVFRPTKKTALFR